MQAGAAGIDIRKVDDPAHRETLYVASGDKCRIVWEVRHRKTGFGVRQDNTNCAAPLVQQRAYWASLLDALVADTGNLKGILAFHWGALQSGDNETEVSQRLMRAASRSVEWDAKRGRLARGRGGLPNFVVRKLLINAGVFAELQAEFGRRGFDLDVRDVEEVLTKRTQINGNAVVLPYSCLVSFSVSGPTDNPK